MMSDETPVALRGICCHQESGSAPEGIWAHELPVQQEDRELDSTIQVLAACSSDFSITRPVKCFVREDDMEKETTADELERARQKAYKATKKMIEQEKVPGTSAWHTVKDANKRIHEQQAIDLANNKPNIPKSKRAKTGEKVFGITDKAFKR